jgi:prepilin-type N-terminal cleavage/methylation domain-containing protein
MRNLRNNKGFTLIELMIVVVIIGILAAIAIPKFNSVSKNAKQAEAGPVLKQICTLQGAQFQETGSYATSLTTLNGWETPNAKYFTFSTTGNNASAALTALGTSSGLDAKTRDCATGIDS